MKWGWLKWIGVVAAGFAGAAIFNVIAHSLRDPTILLNETVMGAALGAIVTIGATLLLNEWQRKAQVRGRSRALIQALKAIKQLSDRVAAPLDPSIPLQDRLRTVSDQLGALLGAQGPIAFARSKADSDDLIAWLDLESVTRRFERQKEALLAARAATIADNASEADWQHARDLLTAMIAHIGPRATNVIERIERPA